ncbi:MAG: DNA ligase [Candidatus Zixiibacteriota bacterium]|nr:MAG: DNA ligase [candidate division Zixibacteria bacterium]
MAKEERLKEYRSKRDFHRTPEPSGDRETMSEGPIFVIQKHEATRLHYDFRLEVGGVLKSWAVPRGPSTDPKEKRLAVATEDHPLDYAGFEGIIPAGQYGGGTVIVWDQGVYRNLKESEGQSMEEALERGLAAVWLEGEKLRGGYALIRTRRRGKDEWLLIKMNDEQAETERVITLARPESVISGKTIEEVAAGTNHDR